LAALAQTDGDAFAELVRRHSSRIYGLAYRMTGNQADAEDVVQETFVRAYRALPSFRPELSFGAWLYRIAVNTSLTQRGRQASCAAEPLNDNMALDAAASPGDLAESRELQAAVQQAIISLPMMYRAVVVLFHIEGRPYAEIADILGLPINTVRTHLHRGRALLRERLAPVELH
jgi:RNA polymerase sigma-70 factor (ECF subfamily)